jgi:asparagine N-glycosylation enzyme membrane subunit Stt3
VLLLAVVVVVVVVVAVVVSACAAPRCQVLLHLQLFCAFWLQVTTVGRHHSDVAAARQAPCCRCCLQ